MLYQQIAGRRFSFWSRCLSGSRKSR